MKIEDKTIKKHILKKCKRKLSFNPNIISSGPPPVPHARLIVRLAREG